MTTATLERCGPYEPGTSTLVATSDGTRFSYRPPGTPAPRSPVPGEVVAMRWTTSASEVPSGTGIVVSVVDEGHAYGPVVVVLWAVPPEFARFRSPW